MSFLVITWASKGEPEYKNGQLPSDDFCACTRYKSMCRKGHLTSVEYVVCLQSIYEAKLSIVGGILGIVSLNTVFSNVLNPW